MLEYTEQNKQQLIVRQSSMDRAVQILIDRGMTVPIETSPYTRPMNSEEILKAVRSLTDALEHIIRTPKE